MLRLCTWNHRLAFVSITLCGSATSNVGRIIPFVGLCLYHRPSRLLRDSVASCGPIALVVWTYGEREGTFGWWTVVVHGKPCYWPERTDAAVGHSVHCRLTVQISSFIVSWWDLRRTFWWMGPFSLLVLTFFFVRTHCFNLSMYSKTTMMTICCPVMREWTKEWWSKIVHDNLVDAHSPLSCLRFWIHRVLWAFYSIKCGICASIFALIQQN